MYLLNLLFYGQDIRIDFSILLSIYDMCAEPLGDPPVFSMRQTLSFNAILYEFFIWNWQRFLTL